MLWMIAAWLVVIPACAARARLEREIDSGHPDVLRRKIAERDHRIAELERENKRYDG
jgi:hypothetical protein